MLERQARTSPSDQTQSVFSRLAHRLEYNLPLTPIRYHTPFDLSPNLAVLSEEADDEAGRRKVNFLGTSKGTLIITIGEGGVLNLNITVDKDSGRCAVPILNDTEVILGCRHAPDQKWEVLSGKFVPLETGLDWCADAFERLDAVGEPNLYEAVSYARRGEPTIPTVGKKTEVKGLFFSKFWDQNHL